MAVAVPRGLNEPQARALLALAALRVKHRGVPDAAHAAEIAQCKQDRTYFIDTYVQIPVKDADDASVLRWGPFHLWDSQRAVIAAFDTGAHLVILKARQLGQTTLSLAAILHQMIFRPACAALLFSRRQEEAWDLLDRLRALYDHLPPWLQAVAGGVSSSNSSTWLLGNGSTARAFPTTAGDSYTATVALCDEFDLVDNQQELLNAVQPTVDAGGQMILLSRVRKERPVTPFKRMYQAAKAGLPGWRAIFLPWHARPDRDPAWYAQRTAEARERSGSLDALWEQYPATDAEALAPRSLDKRLPPAWLLRCYQAAPLLDDPVAPPLAALRVYARPVVGRAYVIGADPAEGNPTSDTSAATVIDAATGAEVAALGGALEPAAFARNLAQVSAYYRRAPVLPERNNHGHALILALGALRVPVLAGTDGKPGWLTTAPSKARLYDTLADLLRAGDAGIRSLGTYTELGSIEGNTLRAPEGLHDDWAVSFALAQQARVTRPAPTRQSNYLTAEDYADG